MDWEAFYSRFREPDFIPGYEIQNRLGGGAFGDVYKARKQSIGKAYAIKFLKLEDDAQRAVVERELSTVRHFAAIDHPNLVTIEDMGVALGVPYLIMGYAGEDTLARRLAQGPLPPDDALLIFVQACRGVLALHDRRLVHFDLKPSNVFLKGDVARVGDYGLSKLLTDGRMTLSFGRGTPQYMAPEILRSRADHRADIYSLGVMLYEALVGELPFKPAPDSALVLRETDEPPPFPEDFPARLQPVVSACLRLSPDDRYGDVGALLADLDQTARQGDSVALDWSAPSAPNPLPEGDLASGAPAEPRPTAQPEPAAKPEPKPEPKPRGETLPEPQPAATAPKPPGSSSSLPRTAAELAKGAVAVATGVWQGLRGDTPATAQLDQARQAHPAHARAARVATDLKRDLGHAGKDLLQASRELRRAADGLRRPQQAGDPDEDNGDDPLQDPAQDSSQEPSAQGAPLASKARAKAQALLTGLGKQDEGVPSSEPRSAAAKAHGPVPVPPPVEGGLVGTVASTLVVGFEVLTGLLAGLSRGLYVGGKRGLDRLLRRSGSLVGRTLRFGLFVVLLAGLGFGLTLLGMVFLEALDLRA